MMDSYNTIQSDDIDNLMNCKQEHRWLPPMESFESGTSYEATLDDFYDSFPDFITPKSSVGDAISEAYSPVLMMPSGTHGNLSPTTGINSSPPTSVHSPDASSILFFDDLPWEIPEMPTESRTMPEPVRGRKGVERQNGEVKSGWRKHPHQASFANCDGYCWRKYGQKRICGVACPRSYYKCSFQGCTAKKTIEHNGHSGLKSIAVYKGTHGHPPPLSEADYAAYRTGPLNVPSPSEL